MSALLLKPVQLWGDLRRGAAQAACSSSLYHWFISGGECPSQLKLRLTDPWPGRPELGQMMCRGVLMRSNQSIRLNNINWQTVGDHPVWGHVLHSFTWLRDLRAQGGDAARSVARQTFEEWRLVHDRWSANVWRADVMGQRLVMWLSFFDFFCGSADEDFQKKYFASLNAQARHLARVFPAQLHGVPLLQAAQGLIYAGLSLPGRDEWVVQGFQTVLKEIPLQIKKDGTHISGSPENLLRTVQVLLDLRYALHRAGLPVPEVIQQAIDRSGPALRFFIYPDRKFALFHGGQENDALTIDAVLTQLRGARRTIKEPALAGIERVTQGRSILMIDAGAVPPAPYDRDYHSAPLSFEFVHGRDRIFVNCGGHPSHEGWQQGLRHTAAHNALTLNKRPVHDFAGNGSILHPHGPICSVRRENKDACLIDVSHDGFLARSGIEHERRFFLADQGQDLRGEDTVVDRVGLTQEMDVTLRFHLHPHVQLSQIEDGSNVVLTLPSGSVWLFHGVGAQLSVETSVYLGAGLKPLPTKQLVLSTKMPVNPAGSTLQIKWALQRE